MLSILIPTYNLNVFPLVQSLQKQCLQANIDFEINAFDDCSTLVHEENNQINDLKNCNYIRLQENIGRSAIRNLLGRKSNFDRLLFIDAGTVPLKKDYLSRYLAHLDQDLVVGGMTHLEKAPKKPNRLRWLYTKKRENFTTENIKNNSVICSSNFMIAKEVFLSAPFDESIKKYGCEDVVFFDTVIQITGNPKYIDNPVIHDAKDSATVFVKKTKEALENLVLLIEDGKMGKERYRVSKWYGRLRKYRLDKLVSGLFTMTEKIFLVNFKSSYPSIFLYDLYRLGYYCKLMNQ